MIQMKRNAGLTREERRMNLGGMKKCSCAMLLVALLVFSSCSALAMNPYDVDQVFIQNVSLMIPNVRWTRSAFRDSISISVNEEAYIGGQRYVFHVEGDQNSVVVLVMEGRFSDLKMNEVYFTDGLYAYTAFFDAVAECVPDGDDARELFSPYDIYNQIKNGYAYTDQVGKWTLSACSHEVMEGWGRNGGFVSVTKTRDGGFTVYASPTF